jgi:hypothetical protein
MKITIDLPYYITFVKDVLLNLFAYFFTCIHCIPAICPFVYYSSATIRFCYCSIPVLSANGISSTLGEADMAVDLWFSRNSTNLSMYFDWSPSLVAISLAFVVINLSFFILHHQPQRLGHRITESRNPQPIREPVSSTEAPNLSKQSHDLGFAPQTLSVAQLTFLDPKRRATPIAQVQEPTL